MTMKLSDIITITGNKDLHSVVMEKDEKELYQILKKEVKTKKRRYVVTRLIQRINKLRADEFTKTWMGKV